MAFTEAIKTVFEKLANFFDILDLSFFVAGVVCLGAVVYGLHGASDGTKSHEARMAEWKGALAAAEAEAELAKEELTTARKNRDAAEAAAKKTTATEADRELLVRREQEVAAALDALRVAASEKAIRSVPLVEDRSFLDRLLGANLLLLVVGVYILGLICFAAGRLLRDKISPFAFAAGLKRDVEWKQKALARAVQSHGIQDKAFVQPYLEQPEEGQPRAVRITGGWGFLYGRLWIELRERYTADGKALQFRESYELLRRYWVLNATYDGVGFSLLLWAGLLGFVPPDGLSVGWTVALVLGVLLLACFREANRFYENQIHEITATLTRAD
jgi:hypothetical protein